MSDRPPLALAYHGVADVPYRRDPHRLFVSPALLGKHIALLRRWGYEFVSFSGLIAAEQQGTAAGKVALTFDDGLADNLHELVPILQRTGTTATVFVVSDWLGRTHPDATWTRLLTEEELVSLHRAGVEIGGHTRSHPDLSVLARAEAERELREGRLALEQLLGSPVAVAAYPYGRANAETLLACRDAGFAGACRADGPGGRDDPFNYIRQDMGNRSTRPGLWLKRDGRYNPLMRRPLARALRRAVHLRAR